MAESPASISEVPIDTSELTVGNVRLNLLNFQVEVAGEPVLLTYKEFDLLHAFVRHLDHVISADVITRAIWGDSGRQFTGRLNVIIHRLRAKLAGSHPYGIESVRGRGYGFIRKHGVSA